MRELLISVNVLIYNKENIWGNILTVSQIRHIRIFKLFWQRIVARPFICDEYAKMDQKIAAIHQNKQVQAVAGKSGV